ncbi:MAG: ribonuclease Z [Bacillota bacterium]|nr:ribonuclease Z [Bacillota bacterium]
MKLILCVSEEMGTMFNNRRQSRDKVVYKDMTELAGETRLLAGSYSAKLFEEYPQVVISEDYLQEAKDGEYCFYEKGDVTGQKVEQVILYCWNRSYPSDVFLGDIIDMNQFEKNDEMELKGNSHDKITRQIFERI